MWFSVACFGVRVSVMFHLMFVHNTFSSVWVAEWPTIWEIAARSVGHMFIAFCVYVIFIHFPFWFQVRDYFL